MIPLVVFQEKDRLFKEDTITITKMSADMLLASRTIKITYTFNLDSVFSLLIHLNEFDEPKYIEIQPANSREYVKVERDKTYKLQGTLATIEISADDIIAIANNSIKYKDIKEFKIRAMTINTDKDPNIYMDKFEAIVDAPYYSFRVNNSVFVYTASKNRPHLSQDNKECELIDVFGNYFIYKVMFRDKEYRLAIKEPHHLGNVYLFRETDLTHSMQMENGVLTLNDGSFYQFKNGEMFVNANANSMLNYLADDFYEEYKKYVFNATRDKNLYTQITNATSFVKFHSAIAYDYLNNELILTKVNTKVVLNNKTTPEIQISLDKINAIIHIPVYNAFDIIDSSGPYNFSEFGYITIDGEFLTISEDLITGELYGYLTASNNRWFIGLNKDYIMKEIFEGIQNLIPIVRYIADDVFIPNLRALYELNYQDKTISLKNLENIEKYSIDEAFEKKALEGNAFSKLFGDVPSFATIDFKMRPNRIVLSHPSPDEFDEVLLIIKKAEPREYELEDIQKDTLYLSASLRIEFDNDVFVFVYNLAKNKIYYINLRNETLSEDLSKLETFAVYGNLDNYNEAIMKRMLLGGSVKDFLIRDRGFGAIVNKDLKILPYVVYTQLDGSVLFSGYSLQNQINTNVGYFVRNKEIKDSFGKDDFIVKEVIRGIYQHRDAQILRATINKDGYIELEVNEKGKVSSIIVELTGSGEYRGFDVFDKPYTEKTKWGISSFHNIIGPIYSNGTVAVDVNLVKEYINSKSFTALGEVAYELIETGEWVINKDENVKEIDRTKLIDKSYQVGFVAIESWLGNELYKEVVIKNLDEISEDGYLVPLKIYDDSALMSVEADIGKYLNLWVG